MAKATEVSPSIPCKTLNANHVVASLSIEDKNVSMDRFMANLQGETKVHFEGCKAGKTFENNFVKQ